MVIRACLRGALENIRRNNLEMHRALPQIESKVPPRCSGRDWRRDDARVSYRLQAALTTARVPRAARVRRKSGVHAPEGLRCDGITMMLQRNDWAGEFIAKENGIYAG
jgi:hypothetical protein